MEVIYEDNHIIAVDKTCREIVQGDKTGDKPLSEMLKAWLKKKYCKPGNVFVGVTHRLDRPVSGVVIFAKTSKALSRLNEMFRVGEVRKTYWAIVKNRPRRMRVSWWIGWCGTRSKIRVTLTIPSGRMPRKPSCVIN